MNFYQKLPTFGDFPDITDDQHYAVVPDDWQVIITDIEASTRAVEAGRYRDVNTLGAAAIVVVHNQLGEGSFPFVFGGDGATMVIPPQALEQVKAPLAALRSLARDRFQLSLRIGIVPVSELHDARIEVAKLAIAGQRSLAIFRGGGLTLAEKLVKTKGGLYALPEITANSEANLAGLSCRWLPIPPTRDYAMSLMVRSRRGPAVYREIINAIAELYGGELDRANPINAQNARYRTIRQCLADERRYHQCYWTFKFAWRVFEITAAVLIFRHGLRGLLNSRQYTDAMGRHSDYRKFDDMLRMVIDCSTDQAERIRSLLQSLHERGEIDFGIHLARESLMTCFFHGPEEGEHLHFVDGGDGGYVMAAKQMKNQMHERESQL